MCAALREALRDRLRARPYPILAERDSSGLRLLPGASLWGLALEQIRLWRRAGVGQGDILLDSPAGIDGVVRIVAALVGGYVYWPVPAPRLEALSGQPPATISRPRDVWRLLPHAPACPIALGSPGALDALGELPPETAFLLETSGTASGRPALIALTATALMHQLTSHAQALDLHEGEVRACVLPWWHAFGLVLDLLLGLWSGQVLWLAAEGARQPRKLLSLCRAEGVEHLASVPRVVEILLCAAADGPALPLLRVHSGGARTSDVLALRAKRKFGGWLDGYGLTECGPGVLLDGYPVGCDVKLDAPFGELHIRTPSLGYFAGLPERLDEAGWFRSFDLARPAPGGRIEILGRSGAAWKDTGGCWVTADDVERWLGLQCDLQEFGIARRSTGVLRLAVALEALTAGSISSLELNLSNSFSQRFGVEAELRACLWTDKARDRILRVPSKSSGEALLAYLYEPPREFRRL